MPKWNASGPPGKHQGAPTPAHKRVMQHAGMDAADVAKLHNTPPKTTKKGK
jgi:hypothetical protein